MSQESVPSLCLVLLITACSVSLGRADPVYNYAVTVNSTTLTGPSTLFTKNFDGVIDYGFLPDQFALGFYTDSPGYGSGAFFQTQKNAPLTMGNICPGTFDFSEMVVQGPTGWFTIDALTAGFRIENPDPYFWKIWSNLTSSNNCGRYKIQARTCKAVDIPISSCQASSAGNVLTLTTSIGVVKVTGLSSFTELSWGPFDVLDVKVYSGSGPAGASCSSGTDSGPAVGGVLGALCGVLAIAVAFLLWKRRSQNTEPFQFQDQPSTRA